MDLDLKLTLQFVRLQFFLSSLFLNFDSVTDSVLTGVVAITG